MEECYTFKPLKPQPGATEASANETARLDRPGLVVITGCGHSGVINTLRYARELSGIDQVYAVVGGFHLATVDLESVVWPTVEALSEVNPEVVVPAHCTGWRATHALAAAFPDAFIQNSVGTKYVLQ